MFHSGQSGNPKGRPKGAKDRSWATLEYWFSELQKDLSSGKLTADQSSKIKLRLVELILTKRNLPNESAEDSVSNADAIMRELRALEDKSERPRKDTPSVDSRPPTL